MKASVKHAEIKNISGLNMEKAGIIGGAGFIGSSITKVFLEENYRVKVSVTNRADTKKYEHLMNLPNACNLEISGLNVMDPASIKEFITGCDVLVHGGAPFQLQFEDSQKELFEPIVYGTENFLNVIMNSRPLNKVIILSCINAYNTSFPLPADDKAPDHLYTEEDAPFMHERNHPYSQARFYADQTVREFIATNPKLDFEIVSLFPTFVVGNPLSGRDSSTSVRVQNILKRNPVPFIFPDKMYDDTAKLAMVTISDVAKAVFKAAQSNGLHGGNFILSSESWKISDISLMLNNRLPAGKPTALYCNEMASRALGMTFKPVNKALRKFGSLKPATVNIQY